MAEVRLERVSKVFDHSVPAVTEVTFKALDHEFVVLVGPSGCGKTTILRMIAGLETPQQGEIFIGGKRVNDVPPKDRDVAMVFQNYALYPHMSVYDNMAFGLEMRKIDRREIDERVHRTARILSIEDLLDRRPRQLSGGQRQRVAVGRSIVRKPQVFLFDEPLSNLDAKLRVQMRAELARLHHNLDTTVIYVTHDQVEAMTLGQKIVVLKDGRIQQVDTPQNLYDDPENLFVAGFIGSPPMNFLKGLLVFENGPRFKSEDRRIEWSLAGLRLAPEPRAREVFIGLRPEDLKPAADGPITLLVDVIEPVGGEVYVYGKFLSLRHPGVSLRPKAAVPGGDTVVDSQLCVSLPKRAEPAIGTALRLGFDRADVYLFEAATGRAIA